MRSRRGARNQHVMHCVRLQGWCRASGLRESPALLAQALAGAEICEEAALDWLCLHTDPARLPRRFAGSARSHAAAAGVRVLAKAEARAAARWARRIPPPKHNFDSPCPSHALAWPGRLHGSCMASLAIQSTKPASQPWSPVSGQGARPPAGRAAGAAATAAAAAAAARPGQGDRGQGRAAALDPAVRAGPAELRRRGWRGAAARVCGGTPP